MASSLRTFSVLLSLALAFAFIAPSFARHHHHHHHHHHHRHHHHHHHKDHSHLIDDLCSRTTDKGLCVTSLRSDWRSKNADEHGLVEIAIDTTYDKAKNTHADLNKLYGETRDFDLKEKYHSASKNYNDAIRDLKTTKKHFRENDYSRIAVEVTDVAQELKDAGATLNDWRVSSELKDRNRELEVLVDIIRIFAEHEAKED